MQSAAGELEQRIGEVQQQDEVLAQLGSRIEAMAEQAIVTARRLAHDPAVTTPTISLDLAARQNAA